MYSGKLQGLVRLVGSELVDVVDDRAVDVPADQVDRRERRHGAPGVGTDELVDEERAVLLGEDRALVQHLEADAVAGEAGGVGGTHHRAAEAAPCRTRR